jgi:hypothetical protein
MNGIMSLNGTFDASDLPEVLGLLTRRGCTGRLQLRAGPRHALVRLVEGNAVGIDGVGGRTDNGTDVRSGVEDIFFEVLRVGRGGFEFQPEQSNGEIEPGRAVRLATAVAAAQQRLEEWREVETVVPSLDAVPRLAEGLRSEEITLTQDQWKIVASVDGRRTVGGIARRLGRKPVVVCKLLKPLVEEGGISFERTEALASRDLPVVGLSRPSEPVPAPDPAPPGAPPATGRKPRGPLLRALARG